MHSLYSNHGDNSHCICVKKRIVISIQETCSYDVSTGCEGEKEI